MTYVMKRRQFYGKEEHHQPASRMHKAEAYLAMWMQAERYKGTKESSRLPCSAVEMHGKLSFTGLGDEDYAAASSASTTDQREVPGLPNSPASLIFCVLVCMYVCTCMGVAESIWLGQGRVKEKARQWGNEAMKQWGWWLMQNRCGPAIRHATNRCSLLKALIDKDIFYR